MSFGETGFELVSRFVVSGKMAPFKTCIQIGARLEDKKVCPGDNLFLRVGGSSSIGKFDCGFDLIKEEFNWL